MELKLDTLYSLLDLTGAFVFAVSGAAAAKQRGMDLFGICAVAFTVACGGGIIRDLCIGAVPPAGLASWHYLLASLLAAVLTILLYRYVRQLSRPVIFFDALGMSLFAVTGAQKSLAFGHNAQVAILLGITTAVGGGVLRDILLNRVPIILEKEIYASAAMIGAMTVVFGHQLQVASADLISILALAFCFSLRMLALRFRWNLPRFNGKNMR